MVIEKHKIELGVYTEKIYRRTILVFKIKISFLVSVRLWLITILQKFLI